MLRRHTPLLLLAALGLSQTAQAGEGNLYRAPYAGAQTLALDGLVEPAWDAAPWDSLPYNYLSGKALPIPEDLHVRYKALWNEEGIRLLLEVVDDSVSDRYADALSNWWNDDCAEIFLDEDRSGGDHQNNFSAWAYHVSTKGEVVDYGDDAQPHRFDDHVRIFRRQSGDTTFWELSLSVYDSTYTLSGPNLPASLVAGKRLGFTLAYCDNDGGTQRESFVGSVNTPGHLANEGYLNADGFGTLELLPAPGTNGLHPRTVAHGSVDGSRVSKALGVDGRVSRKQPRPSVQAVGRKLPDGSFLRLAIP